MRFPPPRGCEPPSPAVPGLRVRRPELQVAGPRPGFRGPGRCGLVMARQWGGWGGYQTRRRGGGGQREGCLSRIDAGAKGVGDWGGKGGVSGPPARGQGVARPGRPGRAAWTCGPAGRAGQLERQRETAREEAAADRGSKARPETKKSFSSEVYGKSVQMTKAWPHNIYQTDGDLDYRQVPKVSTIWRENRYFGGVGCSITGQPLEGQVIMIYC